MTRDWQCANCGIDLGHDPEPFVPALGGRICHACEADVEDVECPSCDGKGHQPLRVGRCETCGGTGSVSLASYRMLEA